MFVDNYIKDNLNVTKQILKASLPIKNFKKLYGLN